MPYRQEIYRGRRGLFVFLLDQSGGMAEPIDGSQHRSMDELASAINNWLQNLTIHYFGGDGLRDYFDIGVLGYRTDIGC